MKKKLEIEKKEQQIAAD
jgi:dynein heavy chain